jgi:hypothetical protein
VKDLEKFYWEKISGVFSYEDRFHAVMIIDDVVMINFDSIYQRECTLRGTDQVLYTAHKHGAGKRFLFLSEDGAAIKNSGAVQIIENLINCFNLNEDTCLVMCREDIAIPNATVVNVNFARYWSMAIWKTVKDIPLQQGPLTKKFAVWFNRGTFYRLQIMKHLYNNYKDDSFISYQEHGMINETKVTEHFTEDIAWANEHTPVVYDKLFENRVFNYELIVGGSRKPYSEYFMEIVAEPHIIDNSWITEKTFKNLYVGKPFIMYSGINSLALLKENGFKTFDPWFDESYDSIVNLYDRLEAIKKEIDRIAQLSYQELTAMQQEMLPVLEHNRRNFRKFII